MDHKSTDGLVESGVNPRSYSSTELQNEASQPPTYNSVMEEIKAAQKDSKTRTHFLRSVCEILVNTILFTVVLSILLIIPITMIVIGVLNLNRCPAQYLIPIWLVVGGSVAAFQQIISICERGRSRQLRKKDNEENKHVRSSYGCCSGLLGCFNFAWFIAGSVWVYSLYPPIVNSALSTHYCDPITYYLAFVILTTAYIIIAFMCCCSCCIALAFGTTA